MDFEIFNFKGYEVRLSKTDAFSTKKRFLSKTWMFESFYGIINEYFSKTNKVPKTFIDVGANYGFVSLEFLHNFCQKSILFEPLIPNYICLKETFYNLNFDVIIHNIGLYNKEDVLKFKYEKTKSGVSHISLDGNLNIKVNTLDSFNIEEVSIIKIDVEGFEIEVIEGAVKTLRKFTPIILFECNNLVFERTDKLLNLLHELDYTTLTKTRHIIENAIDVDILNISPTFISSKIVDLIAVPTNTKIDNIVTIDLDYIKKVALSKLNTKRSVFIDNILYSPLPTNHNMYEHYKNNNITFLDNLHFIKTKANNKIIYRCIDNTIYKTYNILLKS